jgi:hypothetical protein
MQTRRSIGICDNGGWAAGSIVVHGGGAALREPIAGNASSLLSEARLRESRG